jgi:spore maturation protein CgeB
MKVLICGGTRSEIMDGWIEYLGEDSVVSASMSGAASVVSRLNPDIVVATGSYLPESTYFGEVSREARRLGKPIVFWATEDPYEQDANYRIEHDFDAIFSCDRWASNFYAHPNVSHLPLAGCRKRHYVPIDATREKTIDVMFCGVAFTNRREIVGDLLPLLSGLRLCFVGPGWGMFGPGFSDRRIDKSELIGLYARARIVLNLGRSLHFENHRYSITPSTPGPRTFEAALAGTLQFFHEDTYEIGTYFTKDEIPCFSNIVEFDRLLRLYLSNDRLSLQTATLAQNRAVSEHTYLFRARSMVATLQGSGLL